MYKNILKNLIFIVIILGQITLVLEYFINFRESFITNNTSSNLADSFCANEIKSQSGLNSKCEKLTEQNCNSTSCCVWLNGQKCVAGGIKGPTFNTDDNGKTKTFDNYYYKNTCYGPKCSNK
jgi:hypothetical protein